MTMAIVGRTGSGKTYAAKSIVEIDLNQKARICVIDPTGVWWGLRLAADGKSAGFPMVIFGGVHADVPVSADQGEAVAGLIAEERIGQSVIDVSEMSGAEQTRFLTAFMERIYAANRRPLRLVMDEADVMAPQNPLPEQRRLQGAVNKIVRRGRVKGFRPIMITQRPAVLDKSVLSQIDTLVAMRLTSPQDRKAIEEWVKGNADGEQARAVIDTLASLPRGEGWYWAPAEDELERRAFPAIATFDSGRTPEPGDEMRDVKPLSQEGLDEIRKALSLPGAEVDRPRRDRADPELERQAYERGLAEGERLGFAKGFDAARSAAAGAIRALAPTPEQLSCESPPVARPREPSRRSAPAGEGVLNSAARKMLAVLDTRPPIKRSWTQVATLAGLRASGGHFNAGRKALRDQALVTEDGPLVAIASPSAEASQPVDDPAGLVAIWREQLRGAAPKILEALFHAGGSAHRSAIAETLGMKPSGGHWNSGWKELRDNDVVRLAGDVATLTELFRPRPL